MTSILSSGSVNPNSLVAPGVYIAEVLPTPPVNGVPTNIIGVVGTASWGPLNSPVAVSNLTQQIQVFGTPKTNDFDLGTQVMAAASVGAQAFQCVRVADGDEEFAELDLEDVASPTPVVGATLTAKYTGTVGNSINVIVSAGTNSTVAAPTFRVQILLPIGVGATVPEVFDNIGGTGAALWGNIVDAINLGQGTQVPPSQLVTAIAGLSTDAPDLVSTTLAGGLDGSSAVDEADMIGLNTQPLTGMYALSAAQFDILILANVTDSTTFIAQANFAKSNGAYAMLSMPSGGHGYSGITAAIAAKKAIGIDNEWAKLLIGDWVRIQDSFNQVQRFITQQALAAAILAIIPPQESGLNKNIESSILTTTQSNNAAYKYTQADIIQLIDNDLDVIAAPSVGGPYYGLQTGRNLGSNILANGDEFTRLTNFLAFSIGDTLGAYIGQIANATTIQSSKTVVESFLANLETREVIGSSNPNGTAYSVAVDLSLIANGIAIMNVRVAFFRVIVSFLVNLQTGLLEVSSVQPE
jgi:hypothetical protein